MPTTDRGVNGAGLPTVGADTVVPFRAGALVAIVLAIVGAAIWATQFYAGQLALRDEVAGIKAQLVEVRADLRALMQRADRAPSQSAGTKP